MVTFSITDAGFQKVRKNNSRESPPKLSTLHLQVASLFDVSNLHPLRLPLDSADLIAFEETLGLQR